MDNGEHLSLQHTQISIESQVGRDNFASTSNTTTTGILTHETGASKWRLGTLLEKDYEAVCQICRESFPLDYPESWFKEVVTGKFISFGLYHEEALTSLLVAEVKLSSQCDQEDRDLCAADQQQQSYVVYILSLAVLAEYRRKGIATILLNHLMKTVVRRPPYPKMVFLHVLSKNYAAINFYKQNGFKHHSTLLNYYQIVENGLTVFYDGFTFAIYTNGGASPWSFKELCNLFMSVLCAPCRLLLRMKPPFRNFTSF